MLSRNPEAERQLRKYGYSRHELEKNAVKTLAKHCNGVPDMFPGANSISFNIQHMTDLQRNQSVVTEKTDGVRFFLCEMLRMQPNRQIEIAWYLIDRMYTIRKVSPRFYLPQELKMPRQQTQQQSQFFIRSIFDGELVFERLDGKEELSVWQKNHREPIFLVFDGLVIDGTNIMPFPFMNRLVDADTNIRNIFTKARLLNSVWNGVGPKFDIFMKEHFRVQDAHIIFDHILPRLQHENDGLIFTVNAIPYYMGTCPYIWKWKPMHLNTIDFNVRPIDNKDLPQIWSLHCSKGEIFDFIVLPDPAKMLEYQNWRQQKQAECVLECNFDHNFGKKIEDGDIADL